MPINALLYNHQLARLKAQQALSPDDREAYIDLVGHYAERISCWRRSDPSREDKKLFEFLICEVGMPRKTVTLSLSKGVW